MVKKLILIFITSRVFLFVFPWVLRFFKYDPNWNQPFWDYILNSWNYWDAPHFLYIAQNWYTNVGDPANFIVFFPLYPILVAGITLFIKNQALAGITTSLLISIMLIPIFYKLVNHFSNEKVAFRATLFLIFFPTSIFLSAPYSESLYLLLWSMAFLAAFKKKWLLAGVLTGLSILTRNFGILLIPALLLECFLDNEKFKNKIANSILIVLPALIAVFVYLYINKSVYGDPFAFSKILENHWQKSISSPFNNFINVWKIAFSKPLSSYTMSVGWAEGISLLFILVTGIFGFKHIPKSMWIYHLLAFVLTLSTSFILSTPRYIMSIPTTFIILGKIIKKDWQMEIYRFVSIGLLFYLAYLYTMGNWAF